MERAFFNRLTIDVARDLIGMRLVRIDGDRRISGIIIEAEAYRGEEDLGCHAKAGLTPRTRVMYGPPGHAYIYFTYGMHWMLNIVTEEEGFAAAVLIRAIQVVEGHDIVAQRRNHQPPHLWTNGPAKLCQALNIDGSLNGYDICQPEAVLFVEGNPDNRPILPLSVTSTARVGLNNVPEPWRSIPWRFVGAFKTQTDTERNVGT